MGIIRDDNSSNKIDACRNIITLAAIIKRDPAGLPPPFESGTSHHEEEACRSLKTLSSWPVIRSELDGDGEIDKEDQF